MVNPQSLNTGTEIMRFALGEIISKVLLSTIYDPSVKATIVKNGEEISLMESFIQFAERVAFEPVVVNSSPTNFPFMRGTVATVVLVFLKQLCDKGFQNNISFISFHELSRLCNILLKLLGSLEKLTKKNDPIVQV